MKRYLFTLLAVLFLTGCEDNLTAPELEFTDTAVWGENWVLVISVFEFDTPNNYCLNAGSTASSRVEVAGYASIAETIDDLYEHNSETLFFSTEPGGEAYLSCSQFEFEVYPLKDGDIVSPYDYRVDVLDDCILEIPTGDFDSVIFTVYSPKEISSPHYSFSLGGNSSVFTEINHVVCTEE